MSWEPRMNSYQIPYQPLFETTKQEIERSLFALEDKLRKRRQIDIDTPTRDPLLADHYHRTLRQLEQQESTHRNIIEQEIKLQMAADLAHQQRMEQLRLERDNLEREGAYSERRQVLPDYCKMGCSEEEELLRKYEDGSKAKEYYRDLEHQLRKQEETEILEARAQIQQKYQKQQQLKEMIQKQQQYQTNSQPTREPIEKQKQQTSQQQGQFNTPYDYLRSTAPHQKQHQKEGRAHLAKELEKEFDQLQHRSKSTQKFPTYNQSTFRTSSPVKQLKENTPLDSQMSPYRPQKMARTNSMGRMPCNRSQWKLSPHRTSILEGSYLQAKKEKPSLKAIEMSAIKKIQNRLKVSKVIYEDSQFRNNKYEGNHLFNTFDVEAKNRREIKERINGHPLVLKKHAMVTTD